MSIVIRTNQILKQVSGKGKPTFYVPGYLRLKVKNFTEMDLQNLNAGMNATIIFSIFYGNLPQIFEQMQKQIGNKGPQIKKENSKEKDEKNDKEDKKQKTIVDILKSQFIFLFGRDDALKLTDEQGDLQIKVSNKQDDRQIQFTIRKIFQLRIQSDVFYTPFQIINLIFSITVQTIQTQIATIKVNLMDLDEAFAKLSYTQEGRFGTYDLAEARMRTIYSNDRVCTTQIFQYSKQQRDMAYKQKYLDKIKEKSKIQHFQYGHFLVPLYKFPLVSLATIFLPLWLLAIINLGIFFQDNNLGDRIGSIAGIIVAFVALIPTIRDEIPPSPKMVFIEIIIYMETITSILVLIDSISVRNNTTYQITWQQNGLFIASLIISILTVFPIFVLMILHYFIWQPSYNLKASQQKQGRLDRTKWQNPSCDEYITKIVQKSNGKVQIEQLGSFKPMKESKSTYMNSSK